MPDSYNSENTTCACCTTQSIDLDCCALCEAYLCEGCFEGDEYTDDICGQCRHQNPQGYAKYLGDVAKHQLGRIANFRDKLLYHCRQNDIEIEPCVDTFKLADKCFDLVGDDYENLDDNKLDLDDLPFMELVGEPDSRIERLYSQYAVFCSRANLSLCEPVELMRKHKSGGCLLELTPDQIDLLQFFILKLDEAELEAIQLKS